MTDRYIYYVETLPGNTRERPAGLYCAPVDNQLYLESLGSDGNWRFSPDLVRDFTNGATLNVDEVSENTAKKAFKYLGGDKW